MDVLKLFEMDDCKLADTPLDVNCKLVKFTQEEESMIEVPYKQVVG